jgi:hypothetical protein
VKVLYGEGVANHTSPCDPPDGQDARRGRARRLRPAAAGVDRDPGRAGGGQRGAVGSCRQLRLIRFG